MQEKLADRLFPKDDERLVLVNTLNIPFTQSVVLPHGWQGAKEVPTQKETDGTVSARVEIPPQAAMGLSRCEAGQPLAPSWDCVLENELIRYMFDQNGQVISVYDKQLSKEFLSDNGNVLTLYEDRPIDHDAWDIDIYYEDQALETAQLMQASSLGLGEVRQGVQFNFTIGKSTIMQKIYLDANSKRLDFRTMVNWQERHRMLRVAFPTVIRSDQASFDIQYGYVRRNTHRNVSWDMARFEVAAHKYADLSDHDYGVALLNDCKYGYKVLDNVLDLNLLRSPTDPDPDADFDQHEFTYSLLPHQGDLIASDVQIQAIQLNQPPALFAGRKSCHISTPVKVMGKGVSLEVLKKAEKEDCVVIRLVERLGCETTAIIELADATATIVETDILEWNNLDTLGSKGIEVAMKPFEIRTFKIVYTG
jgi:alpha-mannosidase